MGFVLASILIWSGLLLIRQGAARQRLMLGLVLLAGSVYCCVHFYGDLRGSIMLISLFFAVGLLQGLVKPKQLPSGKRDANSQ